MWPASTARRGAGTTTRGSSYGDRHIHRHGWPAGIRTPPASTPPSTPDSTIRSWERAALRSRPSSSATSSRRSNSKLNNLHVGAQHDFFELSGGPTILALGLDFYQAEVQRRLRRLYALRTADSRRQPALASLPHRRDTTARFRSAHRPRQLGDLRRVVRSRSSRRWKPPRRSATTTTTRRTATGCSVRSPDPVTGLHRSTRRCRPRQHVQQDDGQDRGALAAGQGACWCAAPTARASGRRP